MEQQASPEPSLTGRARTQRFRAGAVIVIAVAVGLILWLALRDNGDSTATNARATTQAQLRTLAASVRHPIFWAGPRPGYTYEFQKLTDGSIHIRYLPSGTQVGTNTPYLTVATYPFVNTYSALKNLKGKNIVFIRIPRGGIAEYKKQNPLDRRECGRSEGSRKAAQAPGLLGRATEGRHLRTHADLGRPGSRPLSAGGRESRVVDTVSRGWHISVQGRLRSDEGSAEDEEQRAGQHAGSRRGGLQQELPAEHPPFFPGLGHSGRGLRPVRRARPPVRHVGTSSSHRLSPAGIPAEEGMRRAGEMSLTHTLAQPGSRREFLWRLETPVGLGTLFALGFIIRIVLAPRFGFHGDLRLFQVWTSELALAGTHHFYAQGGVQDYPPADLYVLWLTSKISATPGYVLLKLPTIFADLALAWIAGTLSVRIASRSLNERWPLRALVAAGVLLNPAVLAVGAVWGQTDAVPAAFVLGSLLLLFTGPRSLRREVAAFLLFAVAASMKPQSSFVLPVMLYALYRRYLHGRSRPEL